MLVKIRKAENFHIYEAVKIDSSPRTTVIHDFPPPLPLSPLSLSLSLSPFLSSIPPSLSTYLPILFAYLQVKKIYLSEEILNSDVALWVSPQGTKAGQNVTSALI